MIELSLKKIAEILGVDYQGHDEIIHGVATDSRDVKPGCLFITWRGDNFDGHQFCVDAVKKGAKALLVTKKVDVNVPQIVVEDSIKAFGQIAKYWRDQFDIPVIGVTGSNGKTTVKNMLSSIMRAAVGENYLGPKKSFNNFVGVPLTLCMLNAAHKYAVIEMGMNHFGELSYLTSLVQPDVVAITNAAEGHLAGVGGTVQGVAQAKAEIMEGLSAQGIAVLNADDVFFDFWKKLAGPHQVLSFGLEHAADVMGKNIVEGLEGSCFDLEIPPAPLFQRGELNQISSFQREGANQTPTFQREGANQIPSFQNKPANLTHQTMAAEESPPFEKGGQGGFVSINLPLLGRHNIMNALAATACALAVGVNIEHIKQGLETVEPEPNRLQFKTARNGVGLLNDCYNANPNSVRKAIDVLKKFPQTKILVLGDMRELGPDEKILHEAIGQYAKAAGIDYLFAVGELMKNTVNAFGEGAMHFANKAALYQHLDAYLTPQCVMLVKGSLSMKMAEVVAYLEAENVLS